MIDKYHYRLSSVVSTSLILIVLIQSQCVWSSVGANSTSPGQVQNLRAYVYYPMRDRVNISALLVWGPPQDNVSTFNVTTVCTGKNRTILRVSGSSTSVTLETRTSVNQLQYILSSNTSCTVTVSPSNSQLGSPPSVNFTTNAPSPPVAVVAVVSGRTQEIGEGGNVFSSSNVSLPMAVNSIKREIYWYSNDQAMLLRTPLNGGVNSPLVSTKVSQQLNNVTVLAMAYEWIGEKVYFIGNSSGQLTLWRVPIINPDDLSNVTSLGPALPVISMIVDPFRGYAYWSTDFNGLKTINLRNSSQAIGTISIQHSAYTMDSTTGDLWFSTPSGNIVVYNVTSGTIQLAVNATILRTDSGLGLPATNIALDDYRVYWSNASRSGIFYTWRNDSSSVQVLSSDVAPSAIFSISPGQQPLPRVECLSYDTSNFKDSIMLQSLTTNTTIFLEWREPAPLDTCKNVILNFPTLKYVLDLQQSQQRQLPFPSSFLGTQYFLEGLMSYQNYSITIFAYNQYTVAYRSAYYLPNTEGIVLNPPPGVEVGNVQTKEGIPVAPRGLNASNVGAHGILLTWEPLKDLDLLGNELRAAGQQLIYYIQLLGSQTVSSRYANYTFRGLNASHSYTFLVITSNGVANSSATVIEASTWPAPSPVLLNMTNVSVTVMVNLTYLQKDIIKIYQIQVSNGWHSENVTDLVKSFTISGLKAYSGYSICTMFWYTNNDNDRSDPLNIFTDPGVPDPPTISIEGSLLKWDPVRSNFNGIITNYRLLIELNSEMWSIPFEDVANQHYYDLNKKELCRIFKDTEVYTLTLFAQNTYGEGNGSTSTAYKDTGCTASLSTIVGLGVGVPSAFIVCVTVGVLIVGMCVCYIRVKRKQARLLQANEDAELNHLRMYASGHACHNPQYTWSHDDYFCTDEDILHLGNFPRQNLTLENFIDRGEFGEVYQATALDILGPGTGPLPVAVKTLHKGASPEEQKKFISEAALMRNFDCPNIVKILGVCIDTDPIYIIMELMSGGDLLHFLRAAKQDSGPALLTLKELMGAAVDVVKGCCYLEQARFLHRDIAARNCLVSSKGADRVVKLGDFGLAKDLYSTDYYQVEGQRRLPVRWMAPEALLQGKFTMESDVWSFGVLLWEVMTLGNQPYPGLTNQEVLNFVSGGGRLDKPEGCPKKIYRIMQSCWNKDPDQRPHFSMILGDLNGYLDHLNTNGDNSGDESDDEGVERQDSTKSQPSHHNNKGMTGIGHQGNPTSDKDSPRYQESIHVREEQLSNHNHRTINSKCGDSSSEERGPI